LYVSFEKKGKRKHTRKSKSKLLKRLSNERLKFTFGGRGSLFLSSAGSLVVAAGLAVVAGFFFAAAAGLAAGVGLAVSSSLSIAASDLTTVALAGFFVMVAELTDEAADFGTAAVLVAAERGSPRRFSSTAFSAYSLI
jgi:hypothetical protein